MGAFGRCVAFRARCHGWTGLPILLAFQLLGAGAAATQTLPSVAQTLYGTPFSPTDAEAVVAGKIAVTPVEGLSDRELVVGIACLVPGNTLPAELFDGRSPMLPASIVDQFAKVDPDEPTKALAGLSIEPEHSRELRRYLDFEPGLGLNLSAEELKGLRALAEAHGGNPGDERTREEVRRHMAERMRRYHEAGLQGIAPYLRKKGRLARPGEELRRSLAQAHAMEQRYPEFFYYWNDYPERELPGVEERYFWILTRIRDRPALMLGHLASWQRGDTWMMSERNFYISHFFNGGTAVAFVIPVQEGRLFAMIERLWVDGYSGMAGLKVRLGRKLLADRLRDEVLHRKACGAE